MKRREDEIDTWCAPEFCTILKNTCQQDCGKTWSRGGVLFSRRWLIGICLVIVTMKTRKCGSKYARFFDDFYRRDIDDRNNPNDPNDPNDPAPWGPKRRDRHQSQRRVSRTLTEFAASRLHSTAVRM